MAERVEVKRVSPGPPDDGLDEAGEGVRPGDSTPKGAMFTWLLRLLASRSGAGRRRVWIARALALAVDVVQVPLLPTLAVGVTVNIVLDVAMMLICTWLLGWHLVFLPSFVTEGVPGLDLAPTWTIAVWWATRGSNDAAPATPAPPSPSSPSAAPPTPGTRGASQ